LPEEALAIIAQLKAQGMDIDENDPQQAMQILMQVMNMQRRKKIVMLPPEECIPGSDSANPQLPASDAKHFTLGTPLYEPFPDHLEMVQVGMGCFWCSENLFLGVEGVYSTQVGYSGGVTKNPTYDQVCSGRTNHNEVTRVVYDPAKVPLSEILRVFWEHHNPTTLNQQGNDCGTQYRSGFYYYTEEQKELAESSKALFQQALAEGGHGEISTEILPAPHFHMGEHYHQQYDKRPGANGYCGLAPTGVDLPRL